MGCARDSLPRGIILIHETFRKFLDGRLLDSPVIEPASRVLDVGTGCGIWAADFAEEYPMAEVTGIDVFPQPTIGAPSNCHFMIMDAEKDWEMLEGKFDIIHTRLVPFHGKEVPGLLLRCYEHLKPGGYIEMQESWPPCQTDAPAGAPDHLSKIIEWTKLRLDATAKLGIDQAIAGRLPEALSEAGFVDVHVRDHKWPVGPWMEDDKMKDIGTMNVELLQLLMMGLSKELLTTVGMEESKVVDFVEQTKEDLGVGKIYGRVRVIWARKPEVM
jgi:SAM-dependent methyltransferase